MHVSVVPSVPADASFRLFLRHAGVVVLLFALLAPAGAQPTRPGPGGGGNIAPPGGGNIGILPINPGGGGIIPIDPGGGRPIIPIFPGGGGVVIPTNDPRIVTEPGLVVGAPGRASVVLPTPTAATITANTTTAPSTYQWTITGGRITTDPTRQSISFVADSPGTLALSVVINSSSGGQSASTDVTVLAASEAGSITAPASVVAGNNASVVATVTPARNNDRTFRWSLGGAGGTIMNGQGTNRVTIRPAAAGLLEVTCDVTLQRLVTVPVRSFVVVAGNGAPVALTVERGSGGGTFPAGSRVDVFADPPAAGEVFDRWTGDTEVLGGGPLAESLPRGVATLPAGGATLVATYRPAAEWMPTRVEKFHPIAGQSPNGATLLYHIPKDARALVFLLHENGDNAASWFESPEQLLLTRDLVAAGYGVAALTAVSHTTAWNVEAAFATNPDTATLRTALDKFIRDGALAADQPVFLLGVGSGGEAALRYADQLASATPPRPVKGAVLYLAPGDPALAITSRVPQLFALAVNDDVLGNAGRQTARDNLETLAGRGIAANVVNNPPAPVHAARFRALGRDNAEFTARDAQEVWTAVKNGGFLDANHYVKSVPDTAAVRAALPAGHQSRAADIVAQLAIAYGGREFFSDANARVIAFLDDRVAGAPVPQPARLVNVSSRATIAFLGDAFTMGFTLAGPERATVLLRGVGPGLRRFGVSTPLLAPRLELARGNTLVASNERWNAAAEATQIIAAAGASAGAFALAAADGDTALLLTLDPGTYTITLRGLGGTVGDALVEVYDISKNATRLSNLSTLARITTEGEVLIPGIALVGDLPRTLMVRAVGPGLADLGQPAGTLLGDPRIQILNAQRQLVASNNNWAQAGPGLAAVFPAAGAFPLRAANDAALVHTFGPGTYTLQAGATPVVIPTDDDRLPVNFTPPAATGAVLVEVYEVP